jgi:hypothetical protein
MIYSNLKIEIKITTKLMKQQNNHMTNLFKFKKVIRKEMDKKIVLQN